MHVIASVLAVAGENGTTVTPDNGWIVFAVIMAVLVGFAVAGEITGRKGR